VTTFAQIAEKAESLRRDAGVAGVFPVPVEEIARSIGYQPLSFDGEDDLAGAIQYDTKRIFVNRAHAVVRQRFTMAHEIGHAVLHEREGKNIVDFRKTMLSSDRNEMEANRFAACLLMPEAQFRSAFVSRGGDMKRVATLFGVSEDAAVYRAKNLALSL
jgi:Zn-dependent peptidase ImmA (M78 family)